MKTLSLALLFSGIVLSGCNTEKTESVPTDPIDQKVADLLSKMSIEEKIGQMTQINMTVVAKQNDATSLPQGEKALDPQKLKKAIVDRHVGSILNALEGRKHLEGWHEIVTDIQDMAQTTKNKIPVLIGVDAIHGATYLTGSTLFPHNIGVAASRNLDHAYICAEVTAKETRATGVRWNFDPVFDIGREPLWPRFAETFGEDVLLVSDFGVASVKGYEDPGMDNINGVASCMKHYVGYSSPESGWDRTPAYIPERQLREYYLPQFKAAIDAGCRTLMISSGDLNGIPTHANKYLLTDVLRNELGFEGLAVTDWKDIKYLHTKHRVAATEKEAVKIAVLAGVDMSMVPMDLSFYHLLLELVEEEEVPMSRIDEAVKRILKLKFELGLFENPYPEKEALANFKKPEYKSLALDAARESMTLLKNSNDVLPLSKKSKIFLTGPGANNKSSLHGCWSYSWQGSDESKYPESTQTIKDAFEHIVGEQNIICTSSNDYDDVKNFNLDGASKADVIVICIGENAYAETPGSIRSLLLDSAQVELVKEASKLNKPIVTVLTQGRPRIIRSIEPQMNGILLAYWPGELGAQAIADVIFGDYNPSGKLPFTYPRYTGNKVLYDYKFSESGSDATQEGFVYKGYFPQWPFGYGLSYTSFEYSDLELSTDTLTGIDSLNCSVTITNTGNKDGEHAVELYTRDHYASVTPSSQRLRAYKKVALKAGSSQKVTFSLSKKDLEFVSYNQTRIVEEGLFGIMIDNLSTEFYYQK